METNNNPIQNGNVGDHLANERTFLAWIRTSIGIMGFGFIVVKFSLFVRQISAALGAKPTVPSIGYSHSIGILLVALGSVTIVVSFFRYQETKKQLNHGNYLHASLFITLTTFVILLISILLLIYLFKT